MVFALVSCLHAQAWLTSFDQAKSQAKELSKDILVDFTGSDWCVWCQRLDQEVFQSQEWKESVNKKFVLLKLDFPKEKELPEAEKQQNEQLAKEFAIEGFPTICLLDSTGKIYAKTGYQRGGGAAYMKHLDDLMQVKVQRDEQLKKIGTGTVVEQITAIEAVLNLMEKHQVGFAYVELKEQIVVLDPQNEYKFNGKYSGELYRYYAEKENEAQDEATKQKYQKLAAPYLENLKKYDPQEAQNIEILTQHLPKIAEQYLETRKWEEALKALEPLIEKKPTKQAALLLYYCMGAAYFQLKQIDKAMECLEKAIQADPESQLAQRLAMILNMMKEQAQSKPEEPAQQPEQPKPEQPK